MIPISLSGNRWLTSLLLLACVATATAAERRKPNIIFILADDLGWADLGCYGSTFYETPNLDRLAQSGVRFTQAYAACNVCSPSRASILTGKYPARLHLTDWLPGRADRPEQKLRRPQIVDHLPLEEVTIAESLKESGYATAFIGKWHLGAAPYFPEKQGFDLNLGGCGLGHPPSYFSPYKIPTLPNGPPGEYLTDRLTDEALHFIEQKRSEPFFLYLSHYAVHNPQQAKPALVERFKAKLAQLPASSLPEFITDRGSQVRQRQDRPVYAAMLASLDESVGRLLTKLDELGLQNDTIVVFTSDNGGLSTSEGTPTSNLPLRMGKGWNYEGGIREPLLVRWPGITKPGATCAEPVIGPDYYPTFLEMAGHDPKPSQHMDGVTMVPLLRGITRPAPRLYWHYPHYSNQGGPPGGAIRDGTLKLIENFEDDSAELYDLSDDPGEAHDLAPKFPDKVVALRANLHSWRESVAAQMPTPNPEYRPPLADDAAPKAVKPNVEFMVNGHTATLTKLEDLPLVENEYSKRFHFDSADNPKLRELRERFHLDDVVSSGKDEFDRQVLLMDWTHRQFKKFGQPSTKTRGALEILDAIGRGHSFFCAQYAELLVSAAASLGWVDRPLALRRHQGVNKVGGSTEHSVTEIWSNQHRKWVMLDPTSNMYLEKNGVPLSAYEIRQEWFYNGGADLVFVTGKERRRCRKADLPIKLEHFDGFGNLTVEPDELDKYGFIGFIPNTNLMDAGYDYGAMFIVQDALCDGTKWHVRKVPAEPATDPYFPIGQATLNLTAAAGKLQVSLSTLTPNFQRYEIRTDSGAWHPSPSQFDWPVHAGANRLEVKTINAFQVEGPPSTAELTLN